MDYTGDTTRHFEAQEDREAIDALREGTKVGAKKVEKVLKKAARKGQESVELAGESLDPRVAYDNLKGMYEVLKSKGIKAKKGDLYFSQFPNEDEKGEAVGDEVHINVRTLMHPAMRVAHILAHTYVHEKAHAKGDVPNEALAEAYTRTFGFTDDDGKLSEEYHEALREFYGLALDVAGDSGKIDEVVENMYAHYYKAKYDGNFESLYKYVGAHKDDALDAKFWKVFKELTFDHTGETIVKRSDLAKVKVENVAKDTGDEAMAQLGA